VAAWSAVPAVSKTPCRRTTYSVRCLLEVILVLSAIV